MHLDTYEAAPGITSVRLIGRLDTQGADEIELRFNAAVVAPGQSAVIDLSGVSFMASMGLRLLIGAARSLRTKGAGLTLFGAQGMVAEVLEQASIGQIIPVLGSEAEALERLAG